MRLGSSARPALAALVLVFLGAFPLGCSKPPRPQQLLLASGSPAGLYHRAATGIEKVFNARFAPHSLEAVPSSGSKENIRRLRLGLTDWAIVQRDTAVNTYFGKESRFRRFEVLLPLFPEAVQIFVRAPGSEKGVVSFNRFVERLRNRSIETLAIGPPGSGSKENVQNILRLWGIDPGHRLYRDVRAAEGVRLFRRGEADALALMWGFPYERLRFEELEDVALVSMGRPSLRRVLDHTDSFERTTIPEDTYSFASRPVHTVATWALLVARTTHGPKNPSTITEGRSLGEDLLSAAEREAALAHLADLSSDGELRLGASFFRGLPLSEDLGRLTSASRVPWRWIVVAALIAVAIGAVLRLARARRPTTRGRRNDESELRRYWIRYKHHILAFCLFFLVFVLLAQLIQVFEARFYREHLVYTPFRDLSLTRLMQWLLVFSFTNYDSGLFPISPGAQLTVTLSIPAMTLCFVAAILGEIVVSQRERRRRSGMQDIRYRNHIVICGVNDRLISLVEKLRGASAQRRRRPRVVLLDPRVRALIEANRYLQKLQGQRELDFIDGEATGSKSLDQANIHEADTVVLLADDSSRASDERTLLRALSISRHCRKRLDAAFVDSIYIVAEANNPEFKERLSECDVNEVVCASEFTENVIVQSTYNHGLSECLSSMLSHDAWNEFYLIRACDHPKAVGRSFDDLLQELRHHHVLLVGVKVGFSNGDGDELFDATEIHGRLKERGLGRQIIANPLVPREDAYRVGREDRLLVLARDERSANEAFRNLPPAESES